MNELRARAFRSIPVAALLTAAALGLIEAGLGRLTEILAIADPWRRAVLLVFVGGSAVLLTGLAACAVALASSGTRASRSRLALASAGALAIATGWLLADLFRGPRASSLPLAPAYSWVLGVLAGGLLLGWVRLAASWPRSAAALLLALGTVAAAIDARVLPGLYLPFHRYLEIVALVTIPLASVLLCRPLAARSIRIALASLAAILLVAGFAAMVALHRDPALSDEIRRRSVVIGQLVPPTAADANSLPMNGDVPDPTHEAHRAASELHKAAVAPASSPPSILLITVDALRFDRGPGSPRGPDTTRLLDRWSSSATVFTRAYSASVATFPSCQTVLTGRYPDTSLKSALLPPARIIPAELKRLGYKTFFWTGFGIVDRRDQRWMPALDGAYDDITPNHPTSELVARVRGLVTSNQRPWFAWIHPGEIHYPYNEGPGVARGSSIEARYEGACRYLDSILAPLLQGLPPDVWVVLSADHGEDLPHEHGFGFHGTTLFDGAIHVPLVVKGPRSRSLRIDDPVSLVDLFPTILGIAGITDPPLSDGLSLLPAIVQDHSYLARRDAIFSERRLGNDLHRVADPMRAMISGPTKVILHEKTGGIEAYDLIADPAESRNLSLTRPDLARTMRARARLRFESRMQRWASPGEESSLGYDAALHADPRKLLEFVASSNPRVRQAAARDLTRSPAPSLEPDLLRLTLADDPVVRAWAAIGLGRLTPPGAAWPCDLALLGPDPDAREAALDILVKVSFHQAVPALTRIVDTKSPSSTSKAVVGLNVIGSRKGIEFTRAAFTEKDPLNPGVNNIVVHLGKAPRPESPSLLERACDRFIDDPTFALCLVAVSTDLPSGQLLRALDRIAARHVPARPEVATRKALIQAAIDKVRKSYDDPGPPRIDERVFEAAWEILPGVNFVAPPDDVLDPAEWNDPDETVPARAPRNARFSLSLPQGVGRAREGFLQIYSKAGGTASITMGAAPSHEARFEPGATVLAFRVPSPAPEGRQRISVVIDGPAPGQFGFRELVFRP